MLKQLSNISTFIWRRLFLERGAVMEFQSEIKYVLDTIWLIISVFIDILSAFGIFSWNLENRLPYYFVNNMFDSFYEWAIQPHLSIFLKWQGAAPGGLAGSSAQDEAVLRQACRAVAAGRRPVAGPMGSHGVPFGPQGA